LQRKLIRGGALSISLSGFARFLVAYGDLDKKPNLAAVPNDAAAFNDLSTFDFRNDTELHILVRGRDDRTGLEYGGTVEFEADTNRTDNTDETWIFLRGGFGELRGGDTDSAATTMRVGADAISVGTGGIDGTVVDQDQVVNVDLNNRNFEDATKIVYFSPIIGGIQFGLSYTPNNLRNNGDAIAADPGDNDDLLSAGLSYNDALLEDINLRASIVGTMDPHDPLESWLIYGGAALSIRDFSFAGGIGTRQRDGDGSMPRSDQERLFFNIGAAYQFDKIGFSVAYGWSNDDNGPDAVDDGRIRDLVFGVEVGLLPGLVLSNEIAYFSVKRPNREPEEGILDVESDNDGWIGVARLAIAF
jgi:outer membrane protein OmpU